jgi:hypothetical protein
MSDQFIFKVAGSNASHGVVLGAAKPLNGGDVIFISGKATAGGKDGDIIFQLADGTELIRFDSMGEIAVLGEPVSFEKIRKLLRSLKDPDPCDCSSQQLLNGGCICDGT